LFAQLAASGFPNSSPDGQNGLGAVISNGVRSFAKTFSAASTGVIARLAGRQFFSSA
jgi:hypothetical protein